MKYPKPPIREALFDIRFELDKSYTLEEYAPFMEYVKNDFPLHTPINTFQATFTADTLTNPQVANIGGTGYAFSNKDGTRVVQISSAGFTYNIVNSYNEWDIHFKEFFTLFEMFSKMYPIKTIFRIGTRYINRILLPGMSVDFDDYINYMPAISKVLKQAYNSFYLNLSIPTEILDRHVIINTTFEIPSPEFVPFILDIDTLQTGKLENDLEALKVLFGELRELKNEVFEDYITPKTRELFQ